MRKILRLFRRELLRRLEKEFLMAMRETKKTTGKRADEFPERRNDPDRPEENRDPLSGAAGAHPVGVGVGAATGGAAGAMIGSVIPGAGTVIGGAIGALIGAVGGGYAGKGIAEAIDPTAEDAYWRSELPKRSYYDERYTFEDDYGPAYGFGYYMRTNASGRAFEDFEPEMRKTWQQSRGKSRLEWDQARGAVSDAWQRYDQLNAADDRSEDVEPPVQKRDYPAA
jgi:hypothetical protein